MRNIWSFLKLSVPLHRQTKNTTTMKEDKNKSSIYVLTAKNGDVKTMLPIATEDFGKEIWTSGELREALKLVCGDGGDIDACAERLSLSPLLSGELNGVHLVWECMPIIKLKPRYVVTTITMYGFLIESKKVKLCQGLSEARGFLKSKVREILSKHLSDDEIEKILKEGDDDIFLNGYGARYAKNKEFEYYKSGECCDDSIIVTIHKC